MTSDQHTPDVVADGIETARREFMATYFSEDLKWRTEIERGQIAMQAAISAYHAAISTTCDCDRVSAEDSQMVVCWRCGKIKRTAVEIEATRS